MALILILSLFSIAAWIYYYYNSQLSYWSRRGISGPKGELFWGNLKSIIGREYVNVFQVQDWSKKFPRYFGIKKGCRNTLVISDPDLANEVLVRKFEYFHAHEPQVLEDESDNKKSVVIFTCHGLRWKRLRTISNPIFSVGNLKKVMPTMYDSIDHLMAHFKTITNKPINIHPIFQEVTMDIISRIALGQNGSNLFNNPYIDYAKGIFMSPIDDLQHTAPYIFPFLKTPIRMFSELYKTGIKASSNSLTANLFKEVMKRKSEREERLKKTDGNILEEKKLPDFIDLFLEAEVPEQKYSEKMGVLDKRNLKVAKELSVNEIVGQCLIFLLAGYDTTANSLSFLCYELIKNPEILQKLIEEIDDHSAENENDENLSYEKIHEMKYLDSVIKESLRLHPVAGNAVNRHCMETTEIGEEKLKIEQGTNITIDVLTINYSEKIWGPEPQKFNPERWLDADFRRHPASFLTFGGGPRMCLGMRLALMEEKMILFKLLKNFSLKNCPETEENLIIRGSHIYYPESVTMKLVPRNDGY